tara:strand:- start:200 stop:442 length:243 start_codon:yes stop_codon:yes gene_type:complete
MLSVILNLITLLIVAALCVLFFTLKKKRKNKKETDTAYDVATDMLKDPLIVSRAYFTESKIGDIGDFSGYSNPESEIKKV